MAPRSWNQHGNSVRTSVAPRSWNRHGAHLCCSTIVESARSVRTSVAPRSWNRHGTHLCCSTIVTAPRSWNWCVHCLSRSRQRSVLTILFYRRRVKHKTEPMQKATARMMAWKTIWFLSKTMSSREQGLPPRSVRRREGRLRETSEFW